MKTVESPTTIAHIITDLHTGGAESMLVRLLSVSAYRRASCVLSMRSKGTRGVQIEALGVPLETFAMSIRPSLMRSIYNLHRSVRDRRPRIVQGWMYHANIAAALTTWRDPSAALAWNIRETLQDIRQEKPLTQAIIRAGVALSGRPAAIIYNSRASALQHEQLGYSAKHAVVIPNGIDPDKFAPSSTARLALRATLDLPPHTILVGRVGRFHPMKDYPRMLDAAAIVARCMPDVHYLLGGPGVTADNRELMVRIGELGLRSRVHLLGEIHDTAEFMAGLDVNCSSSAWGEAFPNVIAEAMASGVPCVSTDVGDSSWVMGSGGITVPPNNAAALAAALLTILRLDENARRAIGDAGRRRVEREFALPEIAARYDDLYASFLHAPHA